MAFPTETVYGLGARVFCDACIQRIFAVKGRPADNPLIVHVAAVEDIERVAVEIPERAWRLTERFFPGPLTLVLRRHPRVPASVSGGLDTVAVRMPRHPIALELIGLVGEPIAAPSANRSGRPSPTRGEHVLHDLAGRIAAVVEGGECEIGLESTVLNLLVEPPLILRPGAVTAEEIAAVIGAPVEYWHGVAHGAVASPGMKYRHYAPRASVVLLPSWEAIREWLQHHPEANPVVLSAESAPFPLPAVVRWLEPATLYAEFRRSDAEGRTHVLVLFSPSVRAHPALADRLQKAAASHGE